MKWVTPMGGRWLAVAGANGPSSCETVSYTGGPGTYRWRVTAKSLPGSVNYQLTFKAPQ